MVHIVILVIAKRTDSMMSICDASTSSLTALNSVMSF